MSIPDIQKSLEVGFGFTESCMRCAGATGVATGVALRIQ